MKVGRVIAILVTVFVAVTIVPLYDTQHTVQTIKDEVKALRSIIPMRHPENKALLIRIGKHKCRKAKPKKLGKKLLKMNHLNPKDY